MLGACLLVDMGLFLLFRVEDASSSDTRGLEFFFSTGILIWALVSHFGVTRNRSLFTLASTGWLFPFVFVLFHFGSLGVRASWYAPALVDETWHLSVLCLTAWLFSFDLVSGIRPLARPEERQLAPYRWELRRVEKWAQVVFWIGGGLQLFFLSRVGFSTFFGRVYGKEVFDAVTSRGLAYAYSVGALAILVGALTTAVASCLTRRKVFPNLIFLSGVVLYIISLLLEGDRGTLTIFLIPLFVLQHTLVSPWKKRTLIIVGLVTVVLFSGLRGYRRQREVGGFLGAATTEGLNRTFGEMGGTLDTLVRARVLVPERRDYFFGKTYLWAAARTLPNVRFKAREWGFVSSVWVTKETAPEVYRRHGGLGFTIVAEAYINFGYFAPLFFAFLGFIHARIERWASWRTHRCFYLALFFLCEVSLINHVRNTAVIYIRGFVWMTWILLALALVVQIDRRLARRPSPHSEKRSAA